MRGFRGVHAVSDLDILFLIHLRCDEVDLLFTDLGTPSALSKFFTLMLFLPSLRPAVSPPHTLCLRRSILVRATSLDLRGYGMHCIAVFSASRLPTRMTSFLAREIAV